MNKSRNGPNNYFIPRPRKSNNYPPPPQQHQQQQQANHFDAWGDPRIVREPSPFGPHAAMSSQRQVVNGRKAPTNTMNRMSNNLYQESVAYEDCIRYIFDSWDLVEKELSRTTRLQRTGGPLYYQEKNPNPNLHDFHGVDLDQWKLTRDLRRQLPQ